MRVSDHIVQILVRIDFLVDIIEARIARGQDAEFSVRELDALEWVIDDLAEHYSTEFMTAKGIAAGITKRRRVRRAERDEATAS